jgi:polyisoprenoid-binding protein YceI
VPTRALGLVCALLAGLPAARAAEQVVALDPQRSHAEFQVRVMWLFGVEGRFGSVQGEVHVDREAQVARVLAQIDATRVEMRKPDYEAWVKSEEFFDAARHPRIVFESLPFPLSVLREGGTVSGNLSVRGETHQTTFELTPSPDPCPGPSWTNCAMLADGAIQRSQFGMRTHRATLADKVKLHLAIVARE